ncbi:DUF2304 family protein [Patescibacteria group bacterium]|nr:DUF2304 family protein [Patescibacteria group bacterium]MCL5798024.1 DUF2304 family protein [Patescibacteria group bacterium]
MHLVFTQVVLSIFIVFALSRVFLRFKSGEVTFLGFLFWILLFGSALAIIIYPPISGGIARILGIGRGVDLVIYTSIVLLFYLVFRLYVYLQDMRHELTKLVQKLAMKELDEKNEKKPSSQN